MKFGFLSGLACLLVVALSGGVGTASAQGLLSSVLTINDRIITQHQLDQRIAFLTLLGVRENTQEVALTQLSNEALQLQTARAAGFPPTPEAIEAGQTEFAGRANLTRDQFIAAIEQNGVQRDTFDEFVGAGVAWRAYARDRFRAAAEAVPPASVDQALLSAQLEPGLRVLLSEIILPANTPESRSISAARAEGFSQIRTEEEFGAAASEFSLAQTRFRNGEVEWRPIEALPEPIQNAVQNLQPGQTSRPVQLENAIAVFFMRDAELTAPTSAEFASVEYASLRLAPGSDAQAAQIAARLDRCEDFVSESGAFSEAAFVQETTLVSALPSDLAAVIETLDASEVSTRLRRNGAPVVVMLCRRTFGAEGSVDPTQVRLGLINQRLQILANQHLAEIRDRAVIIRPNGG